jgi:hypothetical protein
MPFEPKLPDGVKLPPGSSINTAHSDYVALENLAREEGMTQKAFSRVLGLEVARVTAARAAPPAPAPVAAPAPAAKPDLSKMSPREQFAHALANPSRRG